MDCSIAKEMLNKKNEKAIPQSCSKDKDYVEVYLTKEFP